MEVLRSILNFIIWQVLDQAPVFLGLIALVGFLLQRKSFSEVVEGTLKTIVGIVILQVGAKTLVGAITPVNGLLMKSFGIVGIVPANEAAYGAALKWVANTAVITFIVGFLFHVLLVLITPFKFVYLTGHMMLFMATLLNLVLSNILGLTGVPLILVSAALCAIYWTLMPAWVNKYSRKFTGGDVALGHHNAVGAVLAAKLAPLVGKPEDSADNLKLPKFLSMFGDNTIVMATVMPVLFLIIGLASGQPAVSQLSGNQNWVVWLIMQGIWFAAGIAILLMGVRMFLAAIVPAFKGISERVIPGAIPALDAPVFYSYAPMGAILGFLSNLAAAILVTVFLILVKSPIVVFPGPIPFFFDGCLEGVFGDKYGGWRGAILAGFVGGLLVHLGVVFLTPLTGPLAETGVMFSNIDQSTIWTAFFWLLKLIAGRG
ncbi:MAG TPA: PTS ascorbate transporter subunit IIC [Firmicutes bacterium]|nr:PTS ascorbate transporter subunit IIC [Candidatus Fermentithermobacillaceae bacterium]